MTDDKKAVELTVNEQLASYVRGVMDEANQNYAEHLRKYLADKDDATLLAFLKIVAGKRCHACCSALNENGVCMTCFELHKDAGHTVWEKE